MQRAGQLMVISALLGVAALVGAAGPVSLCDGFFCGDGQQCVLLNATCDGTAHCAAGGADEAVALCEPRAPPHAADLLPGEVKRVVVGYEPRHGSVDLLLCDGAACSAIMAEGLGPNGALRYDASRNCSYTLFRQLRGCATPPHSEFPPDWHRFERGDVTLLAQRRPGGGLAVWLPGREALAAFVAAPEHAARLRVLPTSRQAPLMPVSFATVNGSTESSGLSVSPSTVIGLCCASLFLLFLVIFLGFKVLQARRRGRRGKLYFRDFDEGQVDALDATLNIVEQAERLPYDSSFEFPKERLELGRTLGSGAFGVVRAATARGIVSDEDTTLVAVKMAKGGDNVALRALASELKVMVHLGRHVNVVNLLGACTRGLDDRQLLVIVEFCKHGSLRDYLRENRSHFVEPFPVDAAASLEYDMATHFDGSLADIAEAIAEAVPEASPPATESDPAAFRLTVEDLLVFVFQIARGMEYLAGRNVLHGDLAARNVLLAEGNVIKICDFGLARSMYQDTKYIKRLNEALPIKWMATESIRDGRFSIESDVWSFGIVLWEVFSLAKTPYPGLAAHQCLRWLEAGRRLSRPEHATVEMYHLMLMCWRERPELRPSFPTLVAEIGSMLEARVRQHYVDLNEPYSRLNERRRRRAGHSDYLATLAPRTCTSNAVGLSPGPPAQADDKACDVTLGDVSLQEAPHYELLVA